jgi:YidC/Oxa1 family membrane protein insertase
LGSLFSFISNPFEQLLGHVALFVGSAGIAIILFTIGIRLVLAPLQIVQLRSARAMQRLQPHIAELRKKHGKDKQKLTEETMKLYKEHKVNPAMGCLPMLLQFPVLIGLFWALRDLGSNPTFKATSQLIKNFPSCFPATSLGKTVNITPACWDRIKGVHGSATWLVANYHASLFGASNVQHVYNLFHAHFLWLSNGLGQPDPLVILPILAGASQWIQSRMMMQKSSDPQQQSMNMLMNFTPLIIVFFAWRYPSGLSLYWVTSTIIGVLISVRITGWGTIPRFDRMIFGTPPPSRALVSNRPKPPQSRDAAKADIIGSDTDADITHENGDLDGANGAVLKSTSAGANGGQRARTNRRRSNRQRGGRRG